MRKDSSVVFSGFLLSARKNLCDSHSVYLRVESYFYNHVLKLSKELNDLSSLILELDKFALELNLEEFTGQM